VVSEGPSTVCFMAGIRHLVSGRWWRLSAVIVGVLAMFVAGWAAVALDLEGLAPWAVAVGFIAVVTLLFVPQGKPHDNGAEIRRTPRN